MANTGGYQIIDLEDIDMQLDMEHHISDIYNKLSKTRKTILLSRLKLQGTSLRDMFVTVYKQGDNYVMYEYLDVDTDIEYEITISPQDTIRISQIIIE